MKTFENLRYNSFWFIDWIKGHKVKKHYNDISFILDHYATEKAELKRDNHLNNVLRHATKTTAFYKPQEGYRSLKCFPVINKNTIRNNSLDFQSSKYIDDKKNTSISTSGSTGAILKILRNDDKKNRNTADTIFFSEKTGFKVGHKLVYLRHWNTFYKKNKIETFIKNIEVVEVLDLNDSYIQGLLVKLSNDTSNKGLLSYASALEVICKYLDKVKSPPIAANFKSIIAMSEGLNDYTKKGIKKYFNTAPYSRYSNMENGIIAQQTNDSPNNFGINWASYHIEILKFDLDEPAGSNELGRIVVTDLFNYCMPMIRYDTGDVGQIDYSLTPPAFTRIEGRKTDLIYNTQGDAVSAFIMINTYNYPGILQSQFIQEGKKEYLLKLNVSEQFNMEKEIIKEFKNYVGHDSIIKVEYVDEIPLLDSGKRKVTINNYLK
ncbi:CoF synthetase [Mariniflexile sp.]|uniref:CoF synthetase n=1 Tax=Mariniflexile sp. TaxID=1979402 RepID=UPI004048CFA8